MRGESILSGVVIPGCGRVVYRDVGFVFSAALGYGAAVAGFAYVYFGHRGYLAFGEIYNFYLGET